MSQDEPLDSEYDLYTSGAEVQDSRANLNNSMDWPEEDVYTACNERPQPSAPPDIAKCRIKVDWKGDVPERWGAKLQKALQSCLSRLVEKPSVLRLKVMNDPLYAEAEITPSAALDTLKKLRFLPLTFTHENEDVIAWIDEDEADSQENRAPETKANDSETNDVAEKSSETPRGFTVPLSEFWFIHNVYRKELEKFEKDHGVSICAKVSVSVKHKQSSSPESESKTSEALQKLLQRCVDGFSQASVDHKDMDSDIVKQAIHSIRSEKTKLMFTLTDATGLFLGSKKFTDVIERATTPMEDPFRSTRQKKGNSRDDGKEETCAICMDSFTDKKKLKCGHEFCRECIRTSVQSLGLICPVCEEVSGKLEGNQPPGTMRVTNSRQSLPGYPQCGAILVDYEIPSGVQTKKHPNLKKPFPLAIPHGYRGMIRNQNPGPDRLPDFRPRSEKNPDFNEGNSRDDSKEAEEETCTICSDSFTDKEKLKCGHEFCRECVRVSVSLGLICPLCGEVFEKLEGNQPKGTMSIFQKRQSLPGYPQCGAIEIHYEIPGGIQTEKHPNPGKPYHGTTRVAYLPDTPEGDEVVTLLKRAFQQKLIFTVGTSATTGINNSVIWNGVQHKTSVYGGPERYGYPDPDYLKRVKDDLKAKGIE